MKLKKFLAIFLSIVMALSTLTLLSTSVFAEGDDFDFGEDDIPMDFSIADMLDSQVWIHLYGDGSYPNMDEYPGYTDPRYITVGSMFEYFENGKVYYGSYECELGKVKSKLLENGYSFDLKEENGKCYFSSSEEFTNDDGTVETISSRADIELISDSALFESFYQNGELVYQAVCVSMDAYINGLKNQGVFKDSDWYSDYFDEVFHTEDIFTASEQYSENHNEFTDLGILPISGFEALVFIYDNTAVSEDGDNTADALIVDYWRLSGMNEALFDFQSSTFIDLSNGLPYFTEDGEEVSVNLNVQAVYEGKLVSDNLSSDDVRSYGACDLKTSLPYEIKPDDDVSFYYEAELPDGDTTSVHRFTYTLYMPGVFTVNETVDGKSVAQYCYISLELYEQVSLNTYTYINSTWASIMSLSYGNYRYESENYPKGTWYKDNEQVKYLDFMDTSEAGIKLSGTSYNFPVTDKMIMVINFTQDGDALPDVLIPKSLIPGTFVDFPDVLEDEWYYTPVRTSTLIGLFSGYADGTFGPGNNIIRQDFAVVMAKFAGADLEEQSLDSLNFPDVDKDAYYAKALAWCVDNGIITGYESGFFGPADAITREQICLMLYRYEIIIENKSDELTEAQRKEILSAYPDAGRVSDWAADAVAYCIESGIISGANGGTEIQSYANANRAQTATIFVNMFEKNLFGMISGLSDM